MWLNGPENADFAAERPGFFGQNMGRSMPGNKQDNSEYWNRGYRYRVKIRKLS